MLWVAGPVLIVSAWCQRVGFLSKPVTRLVAPYPWCSGACITGAAVDEWGGGWEQLSAWLGSSIANEIIEYSLRKEKGWLVNGAPKTHFMLWSWKHKLCSSVRRRLRTSGGLEARCLVMARAWAEHYRLDSPSKRPLPSGLGRSYLPSSRMALVWEVFESRAGAPGCGRQS